MLTILSGLGEFGSIWEIYWPTWNGHYLGAFVFSAEMATSLILDANNYWLPDQFTYSIAVDGSGWDGYSPGSGSFGSEPFNDGYQVFTDAQANLYRAAIGAWDQLIAPNFTETDGTANNGNFRIAMTGADTTETAYAYLPPDQTQPADSADPRDGDIWWWSGNGGNDLDAAPFSPEIFESLLLHELGHTLGLGHTFSAPGYDQNFDSRRYSVMSYNNIPDEFAHIPVNPLDSSAGYTIWQVYPTTPMVADIAAIQALYGADPNTNSGDTTYKFSGDAPLLESIYDAGGTDTIDVSGERHGSIINLAPGSYSSIDYWSAVDQVAFFHMSSVAMFVAEGGYTWSDNVGIAFSTVIENAIGSPFADTITGNDVNNLLQGMGGDDVLNGSKGNDTLDGGTGVDTADFTGDTAGVTADLVQGTVVGADSGIDTLISIENLTGGAGDDHLTGNSSANVLAGGAGADTMVGGAGNDTYMVDNASDVITEAANSGTDTVKTTLHSYVLPNNLENLVFIGTGNFSGAGNGLDNHLSGGAGNDTLDGEGGTNTADYSGDTGGIVANLGVSRVSGADVGTDTLVNIQNVVAGAGDDTLIGDNGNNILNGGGGTDTVNYASETLAVTVNLATGTAHGAHIGTDTLLNIENITGGSGNDTFTGNSSNNVIRGGAGTDTLDYSTTDVTADVDFTSGISTNSDGSLDTFISIENVKLGPASGVVAGDTHSHTFTGGAGNDEFLDGGGADTMIGGAGDDYYVVANAATVVLEQSNSGNDTVETTLNSYTLPSNVESLTFTGTGSFTGMGNADNNVITGGDGNDTLDGGTGMDALFGGKGNDTYIVEDSRGSPAEGANEGTDTVETTLIAYTLGINLENLTFVGSGNFTGNGNTLANVITGGAGKDTLSGGGGNDTLNGVGGADTLIGGTGNDTYVVGNIGVTVTEAANAGTDTIKTTLSSYTLGSNLENLTFTDTGDFVGTGNTLANVIIGGAGNDTLNGGGGADTLIGGMGNDTYVVGNTGVIVTEAASAGTDTIKTTLASYTLGSNIENLTFTGTGNFAGTGNTLANVITGGAGNDKLIGGGAADRLTGGSGADHFVYGSGTDSTSTHYDTITDFSTASDKIDVPGTVTGINTALTTGALSATTFDANLAAALNSAHLTAHHAVEFTPNSGTLAGQHFLVVDLNGVAGYQAHADLVLHLSAAPGTLVAADFI